MKRHFVWILVDFVFILNFSLLKFYFVLRTVLEDGALVVVAVGRVVRRYRGAGQSHGDAHYCHRGLAQTAVAHHTPFGHYSHRIDLSGQPGTGKLVTPLIGCAICEQLHFLLKRLLFKVSFSYFFFRRILCNINVFSIRFGFLVTRFRKR